MFLIAIYNSFYFCGLSCNVCSLISDFVNLSLSFFLVSLAKDLSISFIFFKTSSRFHLSFLLFIDFISFISSLICTHFVWFLSLFGVYLYIFFVPWSTFFISCEDYIKHLLVIAVYFKSITTWFHLHTTLFFYFSHPAHFLLLLSQLHLFILQIHWQNFVIIFILNSFVFYVYPNIKSYLHTTITELQYFFSFYGYTHSIWKFPGQGSNQSCSCRPMPQPWQRGIWTASVNYAAACSNAGSLTPDCGQGLN